MAEAAARVALLVRTRTDLARRVAEWPETDKDLGTSWALTLLRELPSGADIAAVREAARLCDRVVCVRLVPDKVIPPRLESVLGEAGADIAWVPAALVGKARVAGLGLEEAESTLLVQAMLAVLPNLVVVPKGEVKWAGALKVLEESLGQMASVKMV